MASESKPKYLFRETKLGVSPQYKPTSSKYSVLPSGRKIPYNPLYGQPASSVVPPSPKNTPPGVSSTSTPAVSSSKEVEEGNKGEVEVPMFIAMANLIVTPTGFNNRKDSDDLCHKVEQMCGKISRSFTSHTTHILAKHANTSKVELGRTKNVMVVTPEWVEQLWADCLQANNPYLHASLPQYGDFKCPLFYNLLFYFSDRLEEETRLYYEELVRKNGGNIATEETSLSMSFYICKEVERDAQYYIQAKCRKVPCVTVTFIGESVRRENIAGVQDYEILSPPSKLPGKKRIARGSTPTAARQLAQTQIFFYDRKTNTFSDREEADHVATNGDNDKQPQFEPYTHLTTGEREGTQEDGSSDDEEFSDALSTSFDIPDLDGTLVAALSQSGEGDDSFGDKTITSVAG